MIYYAVLIFFLIFSCGDNEKSFEDARVDMSYPNFYKLSLFFKNYNNIEVFNDIDDQKKLIFKNHLIIYINNQNKILNALTKSVENNNLVLADEIFDQIVDSKIQIIKSLSLSKKYLTQFYPNDQFAIIIKNLRIKNSEYFSISNLFFENLSYDIKKYVLDEKYIEKMLNIEKNNYKNNLKSKYILSNKQILDEQMNEYIRNNRIQLSYIHRFVRMGDIDINKFYNLINSLDDMTKEKVVFLLMSFLPEQKNMNGNSGIDNLRSIDRGSFYQNYRSHFGRLNQSQVDGLNFILENIENDKLHAINDLDIWIRQVAYILATIKLEVDDKYLPIIEYSKTLCMGYEGGCKYKGRGFVQLTHIRNYRSMTKILNDMYYDMLKKNNLINIDLVSNPELALNKNIAYAVLSAGMHLGYFNKIKGRGLGFYIKRKNSKIHADFIKARETVNGSDKAEIIAGYADKFVKILENSSS